MPEMPISTQPPYRRDELIQERYLGPIAKQSECTSVLVPQLVTLVVARQMENRRRVAGGERSPWQYLGQRTGLVPG